MSPQAIAALLILILHTAPENPTPIYMVGVIEFCANIYALDAVNCHCIVEHESEWNPNAQGDNGKSVGLWQWREESIRYALSDMKIVWDWAENGDPRLSVWASTLTACHALDQGWNWWSTQKLCEEILAIGELD